LLLLYWPGYRYCGDGVTWLWHSSSNNSNCFGKFLRLDWNHKLGLWGQPPHWFLSGDGASIRKYHVELKYLLTSLFPLIFAPFFLNLNMSLDPFSNSNYLTTILVRHGNETGRVRICHPYFRFRNLRLIPVPVSIPIRYYPSLYLIEYGDTQSDTGILNLSIICKYIIKNMWIFYGQETRIC